MKKLALSAIILATTTVAMAQRQNTFVELNAGYNIHDVNTKITDGKKVSAAVWLFTAVSDTIFRSIGA